jgi:hypothetical protein
MTTRTTSIKIGSLGLAALLAVALPPAARAEAPAPSEQEAYEIGLEAYLYLYPLVTMEITRRVMTNVAPGVRDASGPDNAFHHARAYPTAAFREVVRPNFDTLYSIAWLDLTREPVVITSPDTHGRYFLLPLLDMWTEVFAVPGKRATGTGPQRYAVVPPGWSGRLPDGLERIEAPTPWVWVIGRIQTNGPKDYEAVHALQAGVTATPLSRWGQDAAPAPPPLVPDPAVDVKRPPLAQVTSLPADRFFGLGAELLAIHPPHPTDWTVLQRLRRIGIERGRPFDLSRAPPAVRAALPRAAQDALARLRASLAGPSASGRWQTSLELVGVYGNAYFRRALVALRGLGANPPEDSTYPHTAADADGKPLAGGSRYQLHFAKGELPPARAFWSVTLYDADGFQVANPANRFALGDRDPLRFNPDGSLDLWIQPTSPGAEREANWLPAPVAGPFNLSMRLYDPAPPALDGRWSPAPVRRLP